MSTEINLVALDCTEHQGFQYEEGYSSSLDLANQLHGETQLFCNKP